MSNYIFGRNPIEEMLDNSPAQINKIYFKDGTKGSFVKEISARASEFKIPYIFVPGVKIGQMVGRVADQGVVAEVNMVGYTDLEDWIETCDIKLNPMVLVLDGLEDPHNLGACLRSAAAAGCSAVIIPKHKQVGITATVVKTSAGTAGRIPIIRVTNISQALDDLKEIGFWVCGLDGAGDQELWETDLNMPVALIIGGEGKGLGHSARKNSDFLIKIPMDNTVESLNASVTAALVMFEAKRQRQSVK